jgi:hypothetical protein
LSRVPPKCAFTRSTRLLSAAGALFLLAYGTDASRATQSWRQFCFADVYVHVSELEKTGLSSLSIAVIPPEARLLGETVEACYTHPLGIIGVLQAPALDRTVLVALLPLHTTIEPNDLLFQDATGIKLTFLPDGTCRASGCYARAELSESLLERIEAADAVSFGIEIPVMGRMISTPLAWRGFPEEFTGAPAASAQDERQRWIRTYLPPALSDFLQ